MLPMPPRFGPTRDAPGSPIATLAVALTSVTTDTYGIKTSRLMLTLPESGIDPLAFTNPRGGDLILAWDLHVTSSIGKRRQLEGPFNRARGSDAEWLAPHPTASFARTVSVGTSPCRSVRNC